MCQAVQVVCSGPHCPSLQAESRVGTAQGTVQVQTVSRCVCRLAVSTIAV